LLRALGVEFQVVPTDVDEALDGLSPEDLVIENATRKALAGLELAGEGEGDVALGVDTEVFLEGRALGKAVMEAEARERLEALSGRTHEVLSGIALAAGVPRDEGHEEHALRSAQREPTAAAVDDRSPSLTTAVARTTVTFRTLDEPTLTAYLTSGEWRDRAGAYAIQGLGSLLVERVEGDVSNVVGLPLQRLLELSPALFPGDFQRLPADC